MDGSSFLLCCSHFRFSRAKKEKKNPSDFRILQETVMRKKEEEEVKKYAQINRSPKQKKTLIPISTRKQKQKNDKPESMKPPQDTQM
jgi:hypothetical protein